jgi:hypothetical protein
MAIPKRSDIPGRLAWLKENLGKGDARTRRAAERTLDDLTALINDQRVKIDELTALHHDLEAARTAQPAAEVRTVGPGGEGVGTVNVGNVGVGTVAGGTGGAGAGAGATGAGAGSTSAPSVTPVDLAQSFKQVVESVQAQARAAPGGAATVQSLSVEVKGLVQVDSSGQTNLVLPQGGAVDPQTLSTLHMTFAAVPGTGRPTTPAASQTGAPQGPGEAAAGTGSNPSS